MLEFADKRSINRGNFAVAGPSPDPLDPSNNPASADEWLHDREIRSQIIRWLAIDNEASAHVDPNGVRVLGAKLVGPLDLAHVHVPFAVSLVRCAIPETMSLESADLPQLDLSGSYTGRIDAANVTVSGNLNLSSVDAGYGIQEATLRAPFNASGPVALIYSKIHGWMNFGGGHFHYSKQPRPFEKPMRLALFLSDAAIDGDVNLCCGFESEGGAFVAENTIGGDLNCYGGGFNNPDNIALEAGGNDIKGVMLFGPNTGFVPESLGFEADGLVMLENSHVAAYVGIWHAKFRGKPSEHHGLLANGIRVDGPLILHDVLFENGAVMDLQGASVGSYFDDEHGWPAAGKLLLDGFSYRQLLESISFFPDWKSPRDAATRLRWLGLQPGFHPQPYRQLAKVLAETGDDAGATRVRIVEEDLRYAQHGLLGRAVGEFLKWTIGYGHRPLLTIMWSLAIVLFGWMVVAAAKAASVMRPTYPENTPSSEELHYQGLHAFLYSLDVFLPFVNLHQEHYWWPDEDATGTYLVLGRRLAVRGALVQYYLWLQTITGWVLSAIFVAGVTGLIRSD